MYPLKTSTAITVPIFAHDANGDGVTGIADGSFTKRISKNGGAFAAMTVTITEMENGWYGLPVSTAHSDTAGVLSISLSAAGVKRVNLQFRVGSLVFDDLATPTNITAGTITTATNVTTVNGLAADVITAASIAADVQTELRALVSGTADSGTTTTMVDAARNEADTDYWRGVNILFTSGTLAGQIRKITGFNPATDTITFTPATTQAVGTHTYEILPEGNAILAAGTHASVTISNVTAVATTTNLTNLPSIPANWLTAAGITAGALDGKGDWNIGKTGYALSTAGVQAIWDALTSALTTVGSIGKLLVDNINATISSRSTYAGGDTSGTTTLLGRIASALTITAGKVDVNDKTDFALTAPYDPAKTAATQASVDLVKTKTDQLAFTAANQVDANVQSINDVTITGNGQAGTEFGV